MLLGHRSRLLVACSAAKSNSSVPDNGYYKLFPVSMASCNVVHTHPCPAFPGTLLRGSYC